MMENKLTLIDAFKQFWTVCGEEDRRALSCAGLTYFYLCKVWNATGRPVSFRCQNALVCAELYISRPTLEKHRNILKQVGLIDFFSKGKGDPNITYKILAAGRFGKVDESGGENGTLISANEERNQEMPPDELHLFIGGERKNYDSLLPVLESDAGLIKYYQQTGFPEREFRKAVERWMIQNNGLRYNNYPKARRHFLFWMPNYRSAESFQHRLAGPFTTLYKQPKTKHSSSDYKKGL
jgi:hypothetical protein